MLALYHALPTTPRVGLGTGFCKPAGMSEPSAR
jgi:hypothetical protein